MFLSLPGVDSVIVQHESSGETPVLPNKGDAAYVASVAANSVVEVTTGNGFDQDS